MPIVTLEETPLNRESLIRLRSMHLDQAFSGELPDQALLLCGEEPPTGNGILLVQKSGAVHEVFNILKSQLEHTYWWGRGPARHVTTLP